MKLLFPDACWNPGVISGAAFLYFHAEKLRFSLHPSVSTHLTGADPFDFFRFVDEQKPRWQPKFLEFIGTWSTYRRDLHYVHKLLAPLHGAHFETIMFSYSRGADAWRSAEELISSSKLAHNEIGQLIDPFSASDELFSHIFFEKYLEIYEGDLSEEQMFARGKEIADNPEKALRRNPVDWRALYQYCDSLFEANDLRDMFATAYMFRLPILKAWPKVLLSNPGMVPFLASLPFEAKPETAPAQNIDLDVVAWEFFRQLVSKHVDPIDRTAVERIESLTKRYPAEIDALARRCLSLAQELSGERNLETLQNRIAQYIRGHVEAEIQAVLSIDKAALTKFLDSVFSDEKSWIGTATFLYSLVNGGAVLTAGAAIYGLSSIGSKAAKAAAERRQKLEVSDYTMLYRMKQ